MTKQEFMELVSKRYDAFKALDRHDNFYDYEKAFEQIWRETGRELLEEHLGPVPDERRKKKSSKPASDR